MATIRVYQVVERGAGAVAPVELGVVLVLVCDVAAGRMAVAMSWLREPATPYAPRHCERTHHLPTSYETPDA